MLKEPVMAILPIKVKTNDVVVIEDSTPVTKETDLLSQEFIKNWSEPLHREREMGSLRVLRLIPTPMTPSR